MWRSSCSPQQPPARLLRNGCSHEKATCTYSRNHDFKALPMGTNIVVVVGAWTPTRYAPDGLDAPVRVTYQGRSVEGAVTFCPSEFGGWEPCLGDPTAWMSAELLDFPREVRAAIEEVCHAALRAAGF